MSMMVIMFYSPVLSSLCLKTLFIRVVKNTMIEKRDGG